MNHEVEHQQDRQRFVLRLQGAEAELTYLKRGQNMIFTHTGVPEQLQHQGLANQLAETALAYARANQFLVEPQCRFMAIYIKRHPQHQSLLASSHRDT